MTDQSLERHARSAPEFVAKIAETLSKRHVAVGVLVLAVILQLVDTGIDVTSLYEAGHANAADLIGVGDFVTGCLAALLLKR
jgi:hypothetical protein